MATKSSVGNDQEATNVDEIMGGLERELRLRNTEDGQGNTGSASTSPSTSPASLAHTLASCLHTIKRTSSSCSPRNGNPAKRSCQSQVALSPSRSASSDSSMSVSATGYISSSSRDTESNTVQPVSSFPHLPSALVYDSRSNMDSAGNAHHTLATDVQPRVAAQAGGGGGGRGLKLNPPPMVGRGKNALAPGASTAGCAADKPKPRRTRKSKKPHTHIIEADPENFRDMVQKLTGCPTDAVPHVPSQSREKVEFVNPQPPTGSGASIVRPQPKRPNSMDTDTQNPPAVGGLDASSKSLISSMSSVRGPSSVQVTDQASGVSYSYRDSYSASISCSSKSATAMQLNYCMGYDQGFAGFADIANTEDSGLENGNLQLASASEAFFGCGYSPDLMHINVSSTSGAPSATPLISDSSIRSLRRDDIAKSPMREDLFKHPHGKLIESLLQDEDPENTASARTSNALVDSWLNK